MSDNYEHPRRKSDIGMIAAAVAVALNFGGIVWGASSLHTTVSEMKRVMGRMEASEATRVNEVYQVRADVQSLEVKVEAIHEDLQELRR